MATLCLNFNSRAQSQKALPLPNKQAILGKVISSTTSEALSGAVIKVTAPNHTTVSNDKGEFILALSNGTYSLSISHINYKTKNISIQIPLKETLIITLDTDDKELQEVEIVSTGYQNIPKERATGSFTHIDNTLLNRSVGINILDRMEGVTNGLLLNRGLSSTFPTANNPNVSVHGRSTLFANAEPLVVLDGFIYNGTIDQINPADIENINVLKDAAASSIWGSRSGNGVIIITTKTGKRNQKLTLELSSTLTLAGKPNLFYTPQLSSSDFIELEQYLFNKGFFTSRFSNAYNPVSEAIEIFNQSRLKLITPQDSAKAIDALKANDVRSDLKELMYRTKIHQQYQFNIKGGTEVHRYYMSAGYDKNLENSFADYSARITLNSNNTFSLLKQKLEITGDINISSGNSYRNANQYTPYTPYEQMIDKNGNPNAVVHRSSGLRMSYVDTVANGKLLDWHYRPKDELDPNMENQINQYRIRFGLNYKLSHEINLSTNYQYLNEKSSRIVLNSVNSFYTRNLFNQYSSINNDIVKSAIPFGDIFNKGDNESISKTFRAQVNFSKHFLKHHEVNAIAGYEGSDGRNNSDSQIYYGYDPETLTNANNAINPSSNYKFYYSSATGTISTTPNLSRKIDINQSLYTNITYSYKRRYIFSGSARRDESNIFGVKTNQKGVPLWSAGLAWKITDEPFIDPNIVESLKLRVTYGSNGNVDKSVSAYLTASASASNASNLMGSPYATIVNPPNLSLRWEKVKTWNIGLDFLLKNDKVSGSIDVYKKKSIDLIGNNPIAQQTGILQFKGNGANLLSKGFDLLINTKNLTFPFKCSSTFLLNYNIDEVTSYKIKQSSNASIISNNNQNPLEGFPYLAVFSFPSAGLDGTGTAQGYLNGVISKDYAKITSTLDPTQIKYHGSALPNYFGSFINTFSYKSLDLSMNIMYKMNYFIRRTNVFNGSNYGSATNRVYKLANYENRWKKPGDEITTRIPALAYQATQMGTFFQNSEDVVERGDHVRLNDIRVTYNVSVKSFLSSGFKKINFFCYVRNLGILWRKNEVSIDPDYGTTAIPQSLSFSAGINLTL